ncbi:MAG: cyclopentanol dehydrogenase [Cellvibrionales bacterium]|nr:MAG: cyclopentanol dehydrogenase [Cellvibrionales bacterium]
MGRVDGKVALVTGGAMGMGESHSLLLAKEGAKIVVTDINTDEGEATAQQIRDEGGDAIFIQHDVASEEQWQSVIDQAVTAYGKVDILINNAGIVISKPNEETTVEDWDITMAVNSTGVFLGCKSIVDTMDKAGGGSIVNISSIYGIIGAPNAAAYQASKGAVRMLTKSCAVDFAKFNIRVNSIHPGVIRTPILGDMANDEAAIKQVLATTILERMAEPIEVSYAVLLLASDESSYMTGSELVVDGGYTTV